MNQFLSTKSFALILFIAFSELSFAQINGFVYTNQFASSGSPIAGYYKINDITSNGYMQVDANGVVIAVGTCPP